MALVGTYDFLDTNDFEDGNFSPNNTNTQITALGSAVTQEGISFDGRMKYNTGTTVNEVFYTKSLKNDILKTFIKNNYDYIFFKFNVFYDNIDNNETASIQVDVNNTTFTVSSFSSTSSGGDKVEKIIYLIPQQFISSIKTTTLSLDIIFRIKNDSGSSTIKNDDAIFFTRNISFYAVNRIDLWGKDSITNDSVYQQSRGLFYYYPGGSAVQDTKRIVNTSINTNNYNTIEVDGEMLTASFDDDVPAGTLKANRYDIPKEILSTGFPMTMWFRLFVNPGGYGFGTTTYIDPADISFSILVNDEIAKQIPYLSDCPVEPDYNFDFRTSSSGVSFYDTMNTNYYIEFSSTTGVNNTETNGVVLNGTSEYGTIRKNNNDGSWSIGGDDFTIEIDIMFNNVDVNASNQHIFSIGDGSADDNIMLLLSSSRYFSYQIYGSPSFLGKVTNNFKITTDKYYHVVCTYNYDNNAIKLYVDGVFIGESTLTSQMPSGSRTSPYIGRPHWNQDYFDGSIRFFRMWNERELTLNEIKMRYDILRGRHNIYYTTTEDLSTTDDVILKIRATSSQLTVRARDFFFFDRMINVAPTAANVFDSGLEANNTMNVTGNIFNSNLIGEIAMFYQDSSAPPFGYLWCDGSSISTDDDEKYRTLIEILNGVTRGSTSIGSDISCNLPNYMIDTTGCHLLQAQNNNNLYTNFKHNYQGPEQTITTDQTVVGNYTLDSNYFPSHSHTITTNSTTTNTSFNHNGLHFNVQNLYQFQDIEHSNGSSRGGDGGNSTTNHASHTHQANNFQKIYIEDSTEYTTTINKQYSYTSSQISFENRGNTTSTHIPVSFKVKYAIKYL